MIEGTSGSMNELSESEQEALVECLAALEAGSDMGACLARWPEHADSLRPLLELRAVLIASDIPTAPPAAFQAGREALLERVAAKPASKAGWLPLRFRRARLSSPVAQFAAAAAVLVLLAVGALGASAGAGFEPARDVLSALPVIDLPSQDHEPAGGRCADRPTASPTHVRGDTPAAPGDDSVTGRRPEEIPGVGLCFAESDVPRAAVPSDLLERVPEAGLCIPERLLQRSEDGRTCVPKDIAQQLADAFGDQFGDLPVCGSVNTGQPPDERGPQPTMPPPGGPPTIAPPSTGPQGPPLPTEERGEPQGPQGPSDGFSGPSDGAPQGPSDGGPQGPSDGAPQGPSDDAPQGPSDDAPQGPSDDAPQGPSDDAPQGPSDDAPQGPSDGLSGPSDGAPQGPSNEAPQDPSDGFSQGPSDGAPQDPSDVVPPRPPTQPTSPSRGN